MQPEPHQQQQQQQQREASGRWGDNKEWRKGSDGEQGRDQGWRSGLGSPPGKQMQQPDYMGRGQPIRPAGRVGFTVGRGRGLGMLPHLILYPAHPDCL
jgi:hypothetical protein